MTQPLRGQRQVEDLDHTVEDFEARGAPNTHGPAPEQQRLYTMDKSISLSPVHQLTAP